MVDLTSDLLISSGISSSSNPDFIRKWGSKFREHVDYDAANYAIRLRTELLQSAPGGGFADALQVATPVIHLHRQPLPEVRRHDERVLYGASLIYANVSPSLLNAYMNGGVPSERFITSMLQPVLNCVNITTIRNITGSLESSLSFKATYLMYAKLLTYSLIMNVHQFAGDVATNCLGFAAEEVPNYINIDANEDQGGAIPKQ